MRDLVKKHRFIILVATSLTVGHGGHILAYGSEISTIDFNIMLVGSMCCAALFLPMIASPRLTRDRWIQLLFGFFWALPMTGWVTGMFTLVESGEPLAGFGIGLFGSAIFTIIGPDSWLALLAFAIGAIINRFQTKRPYRSTSDELKEIFS